MTYVTCALDRFFLRWYYPWILWVYLSTAAFATIVAGLNILSLAVYGWRHALAETKGDIKFFRDFIKTATDRLEWRAFRTFIHGAR
jgi:hypothetical protein